MAATGWDGGDEDDPLAPGESVFSSGVEVLVAEAVGDVETLIDHNGKEYVTRDAPEAV